MLGRQVLGDPVNDVPVAGRQRLDERRAHFRYDWQSCVGELTTQRTPELTCNAEPDEHTPVNIWGVTYSCVGVIERLHRFWLFTHQPQP